jgi:sec-independent protein translocase protein TatA
VKGFKDGVKGDEEKPGAPGTPAAPPSQVTADKTTIDVDAKEKNKL